MIVTTKGIGTPCLVMKYDELSSSSIFYNCMVRYYMINFCWTEKWKNKTETERKQQKDKKIINEEKKGKIRKRIFCEVNIERKSQSQRERNEVELARYIK